MDLRGTVSPCLIRLLSTAVMGLLLSACSDGSDQQSLFAGAGDACAASCMSLQSKCRLEATRDRDAKAAACSGSSDAVATCREAADRLLEAAKSICTDARSACKSCCGSKGSSCAAIALEVPKFAGAFVLPDRRDLPGANLPPGPDGKGFLLGALPDGVAWMDPERRTPVTAAAECATAVLACFDPQERNFAGCFASVPACPTDAPWTSDGPACCAAACSTRYQELLRQGRDEPTAMAAAIWEAPSCMPGVEGHVPE